MKLRIIATGGTIDKTYSSHTSNFEVDEPQIGELLRQANVSFEFEVESLLKKDSLEFTDQDRRLIRDHVARAAERHIVITHGTDTMIQTAKTLLDIRDKVIVLTGAIKPAQFKESDAEFNIGVACAAAQILQPGVYVAMNGRIFIPSRVTKNLELQRFEEM
ncbi:MAG: asparaginase domain-containing protein [Acidobacteriota bacterium]